MRPAYPRGTGPTIFTVENPRQERHASVVNYWLVKQEPEDFSWSDFVRDQGTEWTGVRNFQARNNLRAMKRGDRVLFYHSGSGREIVGVARVSRAAYPDPTAKDGDWSCVGLKPDRVLKHPVPLSDIKADAVLKEMALVKQSRLSVMPVTAGQFGRVLQLATAAAG
jgi:predicted RNA-binding protein with PUA-like domain